MSDKAAVTIPYKELTLLERLKLSLEYSIFEKHKKDLIKRIAELESGQIDMFGGKK